MCELKEIKEKLISQVYEQIVENLENANCDELGAAIDMIKDIDEAIYYHSIVKSMKNKIEENDTESTEDVLSKYKKSYMEAKTQHLDKSLQMKELENYIQNLIIDLTDIYKEATTEEKQMLAQKINNLASKMS